MIFRAVLSPLLFAGTAALAAGFTASCEFWKRSPPCGRGALLAGLGYSFLVSNSILRQQGNPPDAAIVLLSLGYGAVWGFSVADSWFAAKRHNTRLLHHLILTEQDVRKPRNALQRFFNPNSPRVRPVRLRPSRAR